MNLLHTYRFTPWSRAWRAAGLCALLTLVSACGNLYTGDEAMYEPDKNPNGENIPESRTPVMVAFSDPAYNVLTKGIGVIDPEDQLHFSERMRQGTYFIYAFRRDNPDGMDYSIRRSDDAFSRYCLVDASLEEPTEAELNKLNMTLEQLQQHGKRASYAGNGSFVNWRTTQDAPYYSNQQELDPFNFYAYFYDDAKIGPVIRDKGGIRFDVEIDGSQDLMCAQAVNLAEIIEDIENDRPTPKSFTELTERLKNLSPSELKTMKTYYYSTFTARYNIWPIVRMQHQMAYVKLEFYPAFSKPEDKIYITNVKLKSVNKGVMTVASYNPQDIGVRFPEDGEQVVLLPRDPENKLIEWVDSENNYHYPLALSAEEVNKPIFERTPLTGFYLLLPPGNHASIAVETVYHREGNPEDQEQGEVVIDLKDKIINKDNQGTFLGYGFMKSRVYTIRSAVYGPQEILIHVNTPSWGEGGDAEIDPFG